MIFCLIFSFFQISRWSLPGTQIGCTSYWLSSTLLFTLKLQVVSKKLQHGSCLLKLFLSSPEIRNWSSQFDQGYVKEVSAVLITLVDIDVAGMLNPCFGQLWIFPFHQSFVHYFINTCYLARLKYHFFTKSCSQVHLNCQFFGILIMLYLKQLSSLWYPKMVWDKSSSCVCISFSFQSEKHWCH